MTTDPRNTGAPRPDVALRWAARIVLVAAMVIIADLALQPAPDLPSTLWGKDKIEHAAAFLVLTALTRIGWPSLSAWFAAPLLLIYGIGIELAQAELGSGRTASLADLVADLVGILAGLVLFALFGHAGARAEPAGDAIRAPPERSPFHFSV